MNDKLMAAKSMFGIVFLLVLLGSVILGGGLLASTPFLVRLFIGAPIIAGGLLLGRWYIRRI